MLRSCLSLSLLTGRPFRMFNVRAGRAKPGLRLQHVAAVRAAAKVGGARIRGASVGSREVVFEPTEVTSGDYRFDIGSAGSATLVMQTLLVPLLLAGQGPSKISVRGGTHNPMAPPFESLARSFVPMLRAMGARLELTLERHGFAPAGGGSLTAVIQPCATLEHLQLLERGPIRSREVVAGVANLRPGIGEREVSAACEALGWEAALGRVEPLTADGSGNVLTIAIESAHVTEVFTGFGERGVSAERVARRVAEEALRYQAAGVPVGEHLADQLLLPMAAGNGGRFKTLAPTLHTTTQIEMIELWTGVRARVHPTEAGSADAAAGNVIVDVAGALQR